MSETVTGSSLQARTLESLREARNYNAWIAELILPYLGAHPLEIGSGLGDFASIWLRFGVERMTLSEADEAGVTTLRKRFADDDRVEVLQLDVSTPPAEPQRFSAAVFVNVLEHIRHDVDALCHAAELLEPHGSVIVFSPAHPRAMSAFDTGIGHYRRYTTRMLRGALLQAGLRPELVRHVNAPGLVAWFVGMKLLRRAPTDTAAVRLYERLVIPSTRWLERLITPPFGQSLLAVAHVAD